MPPNRPHSITLNHSPWCRSAQAHGLTILSVIIWATSYQPPLPLCMVGNKFHSISSSFKVSLGRLASAYFSHSIPEGGGGRGVRAFYSQSQGGKPTKHIGVGIRDAR